MWMSGQNDASQTATSDSTKDSNAAQSSENIYQPGIQCKILLECTDEKVSILQQEITTPFPEPCSTEKKIQKYNQYLQAACQIASILQQIPILLADMRANPSDNNNHATNSNANANEPDSAAGIQELTNAKQMTTDDITLRIIRGLVEKLETRVAEIKSEPIEPDTLTSAPAANGPYTIENLLQDATPRSRSASLIREEKLKALFHQKFSGNYTLLHLSIIAENVNMLRLAIQYDVHPYQFDVFKNQAIHYALRRPSMLLILLEKPIRNNKPLNLNEFYHNGNNLQTFIGLERKRVDPLDLPGYDLLNDYRKACFSRNKEFFCVLATSYFDSLAMHDEIEQELATFKRKVDFTQQESLRFNVLMTMTHINEITAPYQKLIHQLFFHDKVSLADFTLPANVDPDEHSKHIVDLCNKHCGTEADDKGQATQERNQLNVVARAHLKFIDFIPHFRAMHEAIATRFPIWKTDLHAHLREICRLAIEDFCSTRLSALLAFLTGQYRQLESLAMQESYQQRMTAVLLAETAQLGAEYFSVFTESFNQDDAGNNVDDDNSFRDCPSDDDDNTPKNIPLTISEPALLALQQRGADIIIILRFLSHESMRTAAREWAATLSAIKNDKAMCSAAFGAKDSTVNTNAKIPSSPSKPKLFSIPGLTMALSLGNSNPNSAANTPRTNYNSPRTPRTPGAGGSPRPTTSSVSTHNSSPRLNRSGNMRLSTTDAKELHTLNMSGTRVSAAAAREINNLLQRESTPPSTPRGGSSPKLAKAHSYPGVRTAVFAAAKAAAAANAASTTTTTTVAATVSTSSLAQSTIPERHSINFEEDGKSSSNHDESNPSNVGDNSSHSSDSESSTSSSSSSRSSSPPAHAN